MNIAIEEIKNIFKSKNSDEIRYMDIEHIDGHHEALKTMERKGLVNTYFHGYKVYIKKYLGWKEKI